MLPSQQGQKGEQYIEDLTEEKQETKKEKG